MRSYYVVKDEGEWGVKLEKGRYIERGSGSFKQAKRKAIRLALNNGRGVVINDAGGFTRKNMSAREVEQKYRDRRWTPAA
ncbi:MAG: hypothetical protein V5A22_07210 [Salinivenus sp.]